MYRYYWCACCPSSFGRTLEWIEEAEGLLLAAAAAAGSVAVEDARDFPVDHDGDVVVVGDLVVPI